MAKIEKWVCDNDCGKEITETQNKENAIILYIDEKPVFTGSLCKKCLENLLTVVKIIK